MAGLAGHALVMGGFSVALLAFLVAALTLVLLMFVVVTLIGTARERVVAGLRTGTGRIKRWSGWVLLIVGAWFIALAVWTDFFARRFPV